MKIKIYVLVLMGFVVPVNLKDRDAFHLTIEEYLHALISLVDELVGHVQNGDSVWNVSTLLTTVIGPSGA